MKLDRSGKISAKLRKVPLPLKSKQTAPRLSAIQHILRVSGNNVYCITNKAIATGSDSEESNCG